LPQTDQLSPASPLAADAVEAGRSPALAGIHRLVWTAWGALVLLVSMMHGFRYTDYVGRDNDDVMRLVQVRDLLAGQGWFDLVQHRLGLAEGTPMHWSRLIDLPIANLVMLFSQVADQPFAEAAALFVWPLVTVIPLFYALAVGGAALGGRMAAIMALVAGCLFVLSINRFAPGSVDHHNVQLAVMATIAACFLVPGRSPRAYALAGFASALAIAIGAETTPHVAVACAIVALQWVWHGEEMRRAASAFAFSMAAALTAFFYLTVPPQAYAQVACDALSTGFYTLGVFGAGTLFLAVALVSGRGRAVRFGATAMVGVSTGLLALLVAPQCLGSPLADLDPLIVSMWLNSVTEAQSVLAEFRIEPWVAGGFYAVPLIAMPLCVLRIRQGRMREAHLVLLALIAVSYAIALIQVRGSVFSNLLSVLPLAALVAELRVRANADPKNTAKGLAFAAAALASIPFIWALAGAGAEAAYNFATGSEVKNRLATATNAPVCTDSKGMQWLAREPAGVVAGPSNLGAHILRFTSHRALSAPYHRNQGGMLTELHIGMSEPVDAQKFLRGAGVTLIAFCKSDPQVENISDVAPRGLYAELGRGRVPDFLVLVPESANAAMQVYRVLP